MTGSPSRKPARRARACDCAVGDVLPLGKCRPPETASICSLTCAFNGGDRSSLGVAGRAGLYRMCTGAAVPCYSTALVTTLVRASPAHPRATG